MWINTWTTCWTETPQEPEIPEITYKCKRTTVLHTEVCTQTSTSEYFSEAGYTNGNKGTTITYGQIGTKGTLGIGDAFDCDVDGDG